MSRQPQTFSLEPGDGAAKAARSRVTIVEVPDAFEQPGPEAVPELPRRRSFWAKLFWSALTGFVTLAVSAWAYTFVADLIARSPLLGALALGLAVAVAISLLVLVAREIAAVARLGSAARMRDAADAAFASTGDAAAKDFIRDIIAFYARDPATARGREALRGHVGEIIDGPELVLLAERELLKDKDDVVRQAIASAASRVAMVTTVSPRAWVDVGFVLTQSFMLISKIAALYSGRPGGLAVWRLSARVASHLAITGGVAVASEAVGQFLGAGLMSRISAKLGEGVLNGVLTARVGLSAIAVCRPMPFRAYEPPALGDVAGSLFSGRAEAEKSAG